MPISHIYVPHPELINCICKNILMLTFKTKLTQRLFCRGMTYSAFGTYCTLIYYLLYIKSIRRHCHNKYTILTLLVVSYLRSSGVGSIPPIYYIVRH